tara:strand:+ start:981 stop:1328 length:348 start_codon:yes stop_codon:yes gene_type:complete
MKTKINEIKSFDVYMVEAKENYEKILQQPEDEQNEIISKRFVSALSNHLANTENCPEQFKGKPNRLKAFFGTQGHYKKITKKSYFNIKAHDNFPKGLQTKALKSYNDWLVSKGVS